MQDQVMSEQDQVILTQEKLTSQKLKVKILEQDQVMLG